MKLTKRQIAASLVVLALSSANSRAASGVLFEERFESYAAGSNVVGQGGWADPAVGWSDSNGLSVGLNSHLPSKTLDGMSTPGLFNQQMIARPLQSAIPVDSATVLMFDAYGAYQPGATPFPGANFSIGLTGSSGFNNSDDQVMWEYVYGLWQPHIRQSTGRDYAIGCCSSGTEGAGSPVRMGFLFDRRTNEIHPLYDFGNGIQDWGALPYIDATTIGKLDRVSIAVDMAYGLRDWQIDNITVTTVPEPPAGVLFSCGLIAVASIARRQASRR